jgi:DNA segregation ATPase FtsK/SpoIIIE, S-DNA-T family
MTQGKGKRKRKPIYFDFKFEDERIPKLLGLICFICSFYLLIAFISYLSTWRLDQNYVLRYEIQILYQPDIPIENWMGRLGAYISHRFFFWGIGLPSFIFIFLVFRVGRSLIFGRPLAELKKTFLYSISIMLWLSIFLAFLGNNSEFFWGGSFGKSIITWLYNAIGSIGTSILILTSVMATFIWFKNPNFNEWTPDYFKYELKLFIQNYFPPQYKHLATRIDTNYQASAPAQAKPTQTPEPPAPKEEDVELEALEVEVQSTPKLLEQGEIDFIDINAPQTAKPTPLSLDNNDMEIIIPKKEKTIAEPEVMDDDKFEIPALSIAEGNKDHIEPYDPTLELSSYEHPVLQLLMEYEDDMEIDRAELEENKNQIIETLLNYKIEITKIKATIGPTVTLYEIIPAAGVRISKIKNLEDDIALSLAALGIRIIAPIPGRGTIGIEVPNKKTRTVGLREVLATDEFKRAKMDLPIAIGRTISNEVYVVDLAKMPHLLIAGATGQGKSVGINTVLMSLLYKKHPSQLKMVLIDPKKVELSLYSKLENHFIGYVPEFDPVVTELSEVTATLNSLCIEMDTRYDLLKRAHVRNIKEYNQKFTNRRLNPEKGHRFLPYIVLVIDEFADLIMTAGKEIELPIGRLAQLARAIGIHLIIATQRPSVNIITGVIKANFPARIAFKVSSKIDSRTILDTGGAEQLIGKGDMLLSVDGSLIRLQCAFVDTPEVENVLDFIASQRGYPEPFFLPDYNAESGEKNSGTLSWSDFDEHFEDAARLVVANQQGSTSMIQRRLKLGYNRAGRVMDQLEAIGIVGPNEGSKAREVLIHDEQELDKYLNHLKNS